MEAKLVYVLDDNEDILNNLIELFASKNVPCQGNTNPKAAIEEIKTLKPSLFICDLMMPEMDGINVLTKLKELNLFIPSILLSGQLDISNLKRAVPLGLIAVFEKPCQFEELYNTYLKQLSLDMGNLTTVRYESLSSKQADVAKYLTLNKSNKEIAQALNVSEQAIKYHVGNLLDIFEVKSRTQLRHLFVKLSQQSQSFQFLENTTKLIQT